MSSITINMPQISESAIKAAFCEYARSQLLPKLAEKYGFDAEEEARAMNLDDIKVNKMTSKGGKAQKAVGNEKPKVKRGPTGYLLFAADARPNVKAEMTADLEEGTKLQPQSVVTEIAARWKAISDEDRAVWNDKAKTPPPSDGEDVPVAKKEKEKAPKKEKVVKKDSDAEGTPQKKKTTGYLMFAKAVRPEIKAELEAALDDGEKLKPQDTVTMIAARWKGLEDSEREEWNTKASAPVSSEESE